MKPQRLLKTTAVLGAVLAAGCSSYSGSSGLLGGGADATLTIEVRRGPLLPVTQTGEDNTAPVEDAVVVIRDSGGKELARLNTDAGGMAQVDLAAGQYRLEVEACPGATAPAPPQDVTLTDSKPVTATMECDTGIR